MIDEIKRTLVDGESLSRIKDSLIKQIDDEAYHKKQRVLYDIQQAEYIERGLNMDRDSPAFVISAGYLLEYARQLNMVDTLKRKGFKTENQKIAKNLRKELSELFETGADTR